MICLGSRFSVKNIEMTELSPHSSLQKTISTTFALNMVAVVAVVAVVAAAIALVVDNSV